LEVAFLVKLFFIINKMQKIYNEMNNI